MQSFRLSVSLRDWHRVGVYASGRNHQHIMQKILDDVRCPHCGKLLARGQALEMEFKCPRCGTFFVLRAMRPSSEPHDGQRSNLNDQSMF